MGRYPAIQLNFQQSTPWTVFRGISTGKYGWMNTRYWGTLLFEGLANLASR